MDELNTQKGNQVKQEEENEIAEPSHSYSKPSSDSRKSQKNFMIDRGSLLKNYYPDPYYGYNYWMPPCFPNPYPHYYGNYDPYFGNQSYNMPEFLSRSNKPQQDKFTMAKTSDHLLNSTPFLSRMTHGPIPSSIANEYQQHHLATDRWLYNEDDVDESDSTPKLKFQEESVKNSVEQRKLGEKRLKAKMKNETKNIPKNYGKAMITFILSHLDWIQSQFGIEKRQDLIAELKKRKNSINAIVHLKQLWTTSKYAKEFRILSGLFLRKYSFAYIFNSRVSNYSTHIKYKYKLQEALKSPGNFSRIKQF